jgi:aminopeptidase N
MMGDTFMTTTTPQTIYRKDYKSPAFLIDQLELDFDLAATTTVYSRMQVHLNPDRHGQTEALVLAGEELELLELKIDGRVLSAEEYQADAESLTIAMVPQSFCLEVFTRIVPAENTTMEGLYLSNGNFCTQCEAQGFRRITYYPDRPDVLTKFHVRIEASKDYPVLLSNGNLLESGDLDNDRHYALWEDPFRKPSYLFALVAGDLVCLEDHFTTVSGRDVLLQIYVEQRNSDYCDHAMASLKKAMTWDEQVYGLEYDLDRYMIVAVDDFNMGAMENKGLNVFNSKYVLAHSETATDTDFLGVESVIGHEYFHNWTGNRVTCRDWFQLSLKEGLTVFRDQEFSADLNSAAVNRIDDVRVLRQFQFPEDAGPMAHPVRPESYVEINNFYTTTVYNKGAEVIRMLQTLLGRDTFIAAVRLYLERHDGEAATCDDFVAAMEDAGAVDLTLFKRWYSQSGTPLVKIEREYDAITQSLTVKLSQSCQSTPGQNQKQPFHIPVAIGLLDDSGDDLPLQLAGEVQAGGKTRVLELTQETQSFTFVGLPAEPVISPLRGFSSPVKLEADFTEQELAFRMAHDSDSFNRWEAGQTLALQELLRLYQAALTQQKVALSPLFVDAWSRALADRDADSSLLVQLLTLPSEQYLSEQLDIVDPQVLHEVRRAAQLLLARSNRLLLEQRCAENSKAEDYSLTPDAVGRRALKNFCLAGLMRLAEEDIFNQCLVQYRNADNMTDRLAAFAAIVDSEMPGRDVIIANFHQQWQKHPLLLDKWFSIQGLSQREETFTEVEGLLKHPDFTLGNPNRARALLGAFAQNPVVFHRADGAGYRLLVDHIRLIDARNPQLAARMAAPLTRWKRLEPKRSSLMKERLVALREEKLSRDLFEIVNKCLV